MIEAVGPAGKVENQARMEGRNMSLVLAPDKKAQDALRKAAQAERRMAATPETNATVETDGDHENNEPIGEAIADLAELSPDVEPVTPNDGEPIGEPDH